MRRWPVLLLLGFLAFEGPHPSQSQDRRSKDIWASLKKALLAPEGREFFERDVKGAAFPVLEGTLVSNTPADHPSEFSVAILDDTTPEAVLKLNGRLERPLPIGAPVVFEGIVREFKAEPFTLTFEVESVNRATVPEKKSK